MTEHRLISYDSVAQIIKKHQRKWTAQSTIVNELEQVALEVASLPAYCADEQEVEQKAQQLEHENGKLETALHLALEVGGVDPERADAVVTMILSLMK